MAVPTSMGGPHVGRFTKLRAHLNPPSRSPDAATRRCGSAATTSTHAKLLSTQQVKDFIVNGFLELDVPELPPGFNEKFYETAKGLRDEPRDKLWGVLSPDVNALLSGPTCHGAVQSLLGRDYFMAPGNSHMHVSYKGDQGFRMGSLFLPPSPSPSLSLTLSLSLSL